MIIIIIFYFFATTEQNRIKILQKLKCIGGREEGRGIRGRFFFGGRGRNLYDWLFIYCYFTVINMAENFKKLNQF